MNKYKKLIEYVENDEIEKANALFHDIIVDESRDIYDSLMSEEFGGDEADELMNDISIDEEGMTEMEEDDMEPEYSDDMEMGSEDEMEMGSEDEMAGDPEELEDRVVDLEDSLEELMAEFEAMMGNDEDDMEMGSEDDMEMGSEDEYEDEMETEMEGIFNENVTLTKVTKGLSNSTEEGTINKKSVNADNTGKKGAIAKPQQSSGEDNGRPSPSVKAGNGTTAPKQARVSEPKKKGEDAAVNKKSTLK